MPSQSVRFPTCVGGVSSVRAYSSFYGNQGDGSIAKGLNVDNSDGIGSDDGYTLKNACSLLQMLKVFCSKRLKMQLRSEARTLHVGGVGGVAALVGTGECGEFIVYAVYKASFSGNTIQAGSLEGKVVEKGLTATSLLNAEKFPIIVPNSLFSSQSIVNRSRAQWRAMGTKIPIRINNLEKISQISNDIKFMLKSNSKIFLDEEVPYCFLRIECAYPELVFGCFLRQMSKDELYSSKQDILPQAIQIIKEHGVLLSIPTPDLTSQ